jgi:hypothetical protein
MSIYFRSAKVSDHTPTDAPLERSVVIGAGDRTFGAVCPATLIGAPFAGG